MYLPCNLRRIRGRRKLSEIALASCVPSPKLSQIERGIMVPADKDFEGLERAYGAPPEDWWPPAVLRVLQLDAEDEAA